jgi:nifR3 family TIM-barrel protein
VRRLVDADRVDHVDLNFGCPVPKVTRLGGGAALPARPRLLAAIVAAAVAAAGRVPVTVKLRIGIDDEHHTAVTAGLAAQDSGASAVLLHARTSEQRYAGAADWSAIADLKAAVRHVPVLGNGDIWEASDAVRMLAETGCDGVVVGRGCLGRPWLFGDLADALAGRPVRPAPTLGEMRDVLAEHGRLLAAWHGERHGMLQLRKHCGWYLTGYPVGPALRRDLGLVSSLAELEDRLACLDPTLTLVPGGERFARGHTDGPRRVVLPQGWLDDPDSMVGPDPAGDLLVSGG